MQTLEEPSRNAGRTLQDKAVEIAQGGDGMEKHTYIPLRDTDGEEELESSAVGLEAAAWLGRRLRRPIERKSMKPSFGVCACKSGMSLASMECMGIGPEE